MTAKRTQRTRRLVRYESLDDMPPAPPLNKRFLAMTDEEVERRAKNDPDAGVIPPGFWDNAKVVMPQTKQQITLRLDPDVIHWFKRTGRGYQSRMGAVLKSYVETKKAQR
jgi:uncharacterized protein (DUF4415 family)